MLWVGSRISWLFRCFFDVAKAKRHWRGGVFRLSAWRWTTRCEGEYDCGEKVVFSYWGDMLCPAVHGIQFLCQCGHSHRHSPAALYAFAACAGGPDWGDFTETFSWELRWLTAIFISLKANLISTILGCPIAWFLQLLASIPVGIGIESFFAGNERAESLSDFLGMMVVVLPSPGLEGELFWLLPLGGLVGLLPAYFVSVWFEYPFIGRQADKQGVHPKRLMYRVNIFSYALLFGVCSFTLICCRVGKFLYFLLIYN